MRPKSKFAHLNHTGGARGSNRVAADTFLRWGKMASERDRRAAGFLHWGKGAGARRHNPTFDISPLQCLFSPWAKAFAKPSTFGINALCFLNTFDLSRTRRVMHLRCSHSLTQLSGVLWRLPAGLTCTA